MRSHPIADWHPCEPPPSRRPGFGLTLVSESTTGVLHAAELSSAAATPLLQPEEVGSQTAALLLEEIARVRPPVCDDRI